MYVYMYICVYVYICILRASEAFGPNYGKNGPDRAALAIHPAAPGSLKAPSCMVGIRACAASLCPEKH